MKMHISKTIHRFRLIQGHQFVNTFLEVHADSREGLESLVSGRLAQWIVSNRPHRDGSKLTHSALVGCCKKDWLQVRQSMPFGYHLKWDIIGVWEEQTRPVKAQHVLNYLAYEVLNELREDSSPQVD